MSIAARLRHEARQCLERARNLLAGPGPAATRYACLELRQAIEYLAYQQLAAYLDEVPDDAMRQWTPRDVIAQMLDVDPRAEKTTTISIGPEDVPGQPATKMTTLGEDRRFTLKWANRSHSALGNFLHAPTLHQFEAGSAADETKMRGKAQEVADVIAHTLDTPIFNANFGSFYEIPCSCGRKFKRRAGSFTVEGGIICPNTECRRIWDVVPQEGSQVTIKPRRVEYVCHRCGQTNFVDSHLLKPGLKVRCECGAAGDVALAILAPEEPSAEGTSAQSRPRRG